MTTVIDLDGTLIPENSLRMFGRSFISLLRSRGETAMLFRLSWWAALRKLRLVSHRRAKWEMMYMACRLLSEKEFADFAAKLAAKVRPQFRQLPHPCILATAAPAEYARPLAGLLGFDGCVATVTTPTYNIYKETRGAEKLAALLTLATPPYHFFTDHTDDLPLARFTEENGGEVTWVK